MKLGVVSDTHIRTMQGVSKLAGIVETHLADVDVFLHAGDMVDIAIYDYLAGRANTIAVQGNMDNPSVRGRFPTQRIFEVEGSRIGLIHGWGPPAGITERVQAELGPLDVIVFGHTHRPMNERIGATLFFNPGSATDQARAAANSVGILEIHGGVLGSIVYV